MIGRRKGHRVAVVMPDNVTLERRQLIALHGAEVIDSRAPSARTAPSRSRASSWPATRAS